MDLDLYDFNKSKAEVFLNRESKKPARIQSYPSAYIIATKLKEKLEDNDIPSTFFKAYTKNGYRTGEAACCSIRLSDAFYVKTKHGILNKGSVEIACNPENYRWQCYAELGGYYVDTNGITTGYHFTSRIQYNIVDTIEEFIDGVFNAIKKNARYGKINLPVIK